MATKQKTKKPNVFVRLGRFFKASWSELKKVTWPTFRTVCKNTLIVLVIVAAFTLVVVGIDQLLLWLLIGLPTGA